jgi:hypothetical protein
LRQVESVGEAGQSLERFFTEVSRETIAMSECAAAKMAKLEAEHRTVCLDGAKIERLKRKCDIEL